MRAQPSLYRLSPDDDDDLDDEDREDEDEEVDEDEGDDEDEEVWQVRLTGREEIPTLAGLFALFAGVRHDRASLPWPHTLRS